MNFICPRCNYNTYKKSNILRHLSRKKLCKLNNLDVDPKDYKNIILYEYKTNDIISFILKHNDKMCVNLRDYNDPNIDYVTKVHYNNFLKDINTAYLNMFKLIYFNKSYTENHCIKKTNIKNNIIFTYRNGNWETNEIESVMDSILDCIYEAFDKESHDSRLNQLETKMNTDKVFKNTVIKKILIQSLNFRNL